MANPLDMAIQAQQIRLLDNQNRQIEEEANSKFVHEASSTPIETSVISAKVTVGFPNKEEKIFRFERRPTLQPLDLGSKWSKCMIGFDETPSGLKFVELKCTPIRNAAPTEDRFRIYATRAACIPGAGVVFFVEDSGRVTKLVTGYTIQMECG